MAHMRYEKMTYAAFSLRKTGQIKGRQTDPAIYVMFLYRIWEVSIIDGVDFRSFKWLVFLKENAAYGMFSYRIWEVSIIDGVDFRSFKWLVFLKENKPNKR